MRRFVGLLLVGWLLAAAPAARAGGRKIGRVRVDKGYIDAHFAASPDGTKVAYFHVVTDTDVRLVVASTKGSRVLKKTAMVKYTAMPSNVAWTSDGRFVVVSWMVGKAKNWVLWDWKAGVLKSFPKVKDLRCSVSKARCVLYTRSERRGMIIHVATLLSYPALRKKATYRLATDDRGRVTKPVMELLYFRDDYLKAVGKIRGRYDKARDIRLPDKEAVYDLVTKKVVSEKPIKDAIGWEKMRRFRKKHPALDPVLVIEEEGGRRMVLVTKNNERKPVTLSQNVLKFQAASLRQQFVGGQAFFSLIVDPQNPLALKQRRSDKEVFVLFRLQGGRAASVLTLPSSKTVHVWSVGKGVVADMKLHKNWGLGAGEFVLYSF